MLQPQKAYEFLGFLSSCSKALQIHMVFDHDDQKPHESIYGFEVAIYVLLMVYLEQRSSNDLKDAEHARTCQC